MNEMTFRTKLLTDPQNLDQEMLAFLEQNPDKKKAVKQAREFDQAIANALDVDIPEGLQARILLNQSYQQTDEFENPAAVVTDGVLSLEAESNQANKSSAVVWLIRPFSNWKGGLAASVVVFALLFGVLQNTHHNPLLTGEAMVDHILEHIAHDPTLMTAVKLPESDKEMNELFATVGAQLQKPVEGMSYAGICDVEGQEGLHIVMQENGQPVTIIVMPGHQMTATEAFHKSGYHGELIPVNGGVVAIVANTMEQVALAQVRFFKAVKFA